MLSIVLSTIAFFVARHYIKRWADENDLPKGMTRSTSIFILSIGIAYGVAWLADKLTGG